MNPPSLPPLPPFPPTSFRRNFTRRTTPCAIHPKTYGLWPMWVDSCTKNSVYVFLVQKLFSNYSFNGFRSKNVFKLFRLTVSGPKSFSNRFCLAVSGTTSFSNYFVYRFCVRKTVSNFSCNGFWSKIVFELYLVTVSGQIPFSNYFVSKKLLQIFLFNGSWSTTVLKLFRITISC